MDKTTKIIVWLVVLVIVLLIIISFFGNKHSRNYVKELNSSIDKCVAKGWGLEYSDLTVDKIEEAYPVLVHLENLVTENTPEQSLNFLASQSSEFSKILNAFKEKDWNNEKIIVGLLFFKKEYERIKNNCENYINY